MTTIVQLAQVGRCATAVVRSITSRQKSVQGYDAGSQFRTVSIPSAHFASMKYSKRHGADSIHRIMFTKTSVDKNVIVAKPLDITRASGQVYVFGSSFLRISLAPGDSHSGSTTLPVLAATS